MIFYHGGLNVYSTSSTQSKQLFFHKLLEKHYSTSDPTNTGISWKCLENVCSQAETMMVVMAVMVVMPVIMVMMVMMVII